MPRACPHHGFSELTQIDTFYNGFNEQDQNSLNAVAGGKLLSKTTREALKIIENKSKVRYSKSKSNVSRNLVEIVNKQVITPATAKAVEKTCVICGGAYAYYDCIATGSNQPSVCAAAGTYNQVSSPNRANNQIPQPSFAPMQNSFFQNQASTSGTLSSNNVPNPKGEMKAVTTRSGLAYEGPSIPTNSSLEKPPQEISIQEMEDLKQQYLDEMKRLSNSEYCDEIKIAELTENSNVTPSLSIEEPDNSLSMGDEHLDTIPATESDEFIKSSVENLIPIPSESEGIPGHMCDVPFHDNSPPLDVSKDQFEDFSEFNEEFSSTDDDSFSIDKIDYVEASPPDSELVSSEMMEIVIPEIEALNDNPITFYDPIISGTPPTLTPSGESDFFLEEVDAFLAIEDEPNSSQFPKSYLDPKGGILLLEAFLNDDHSSDLKTKSSSTSLKSLLEETNTFDNSLPESVTLCFYVEEISNGSTTSRSDISLPEYKASYDDQSFFDEDVSEKIFLKPLFEEEIIPMKIDPHPDNAESIPSGIDGTDCDFEEDIRLIEKLLYDNSSPRPPKEFVSANSDAEIESFSPSPILVKDNDSLTEEINLSCTLDYLMPPGIEDDDYDSERDILILKDLPSKDTLSFPKKESFHFDIPSFSRPPAKPPAGNTGILNIKMMGDISDQKAFMHKLMITLVPHQEKSPDLLSHRGLKAF
uniref:Reverse transcriptase domain-containing protein n=1 Tax=Tanacetum cinerariifolium TaxID=118510 RepID=A0A6L2LRI7_TANCI|nr:reverse transcriptase domain-containing protein [Tanacetum cinerariifolium]